MVSVDFFFSDYCWLIWFECLRVCLTVIHCLNEWKKRTVFLQILFICHDDGNVWSRFRDKTGWYMLKMNRSCWVLSTGHKLCIHSYLSFSLCFWSVLLNFDDNMIVERRNQNVFSSTDNQLLRRRDEVTRKTKEKIFHFTLLPLRKD